VYTDAMKRAFQSVSHHCPKGFGVELVDNEHFISVRVDPDRMARLDDFNQRRAVEYLAMVYKALTDNGAIVLLVRPKMVE
jgi:hypothetical protein